MSEDQAGPESHQVDTEALAKLAARCQAWLEHDKAFAVLLKDALVIDPELSELIANQLDVTPRIVGKWADGTATPHAQIQTRIMQALASLQANG